MELLTTSEKVSWPHYLGIFLLSLATLLLELSLTRVLSVALWYHFGFLIISTALLGFGTSGVVLALWSRLREKARLDHTLACLALAFSVTTVLCFWLLQRIPFDPFSLLADRRQLFFMPLYYTLIAVPFFCSGLGLALLFTRGTRQIHRLYAFDLFGAGIGCGAIALVMPAFGGSGSVVVAAAVGLLAAAVFAIGKARSWVVNCLALCVAAFGLAFIADSALPISVTPNKRLPKQTPIYSAWNTFSKIDLYEVPPGLRGPGARRSLRAFVFDAGTAVTSLQDLRPGACTYLRDNSNDADYPSGIAYVGKRNPSVLIIGSGAGAQVLDALHFNARKITAVEINPIINDVVSRRMDDYWGGLFHQPEVTLVTDEGRSYVRRSRERYDAIISVHTISNAAIASGALSLAENYVLTREAFEDYLDHLTPNGVLYFTRPEIQIARLFATAREVLTARGALDPAAHVYAYRVPPGARMPKTRPSFSAGFLLKKSPFTPEEVHRIEALLGVGRPPRRPDELTPEVLYSPFALHSENLYDRILTARDLRTVYAAQSAQIEPATDDRPFFNHHTRWSSINLQTFADLFTQQRLARLALEDRPVAEVTLLVLLVQTIVIAAVFILLPLVWSSREGLRRTPNRWRFLLYFGGLGLGFIMIEIALLSRFTLFLGQPVYTFAVVLASLLTYTGAGAFLSGRFGLQPRQALLRMIPLLLVVLIATAFLIPILSSAALGAALMWRVAVAVVVLSPLGILMGMPFPTGLRVVSAQAPVLVPWCWGVNGFFTVIGTVVGLMIAMTLGFKAVLLAGALCYLMALVAIVPNQGETIGTPSCLKAHETEMKA